VVIEDSYHLLRMSFSGRIALQLQQDLHGGCGNTTGLLDPAHGHIVSDGARACGGVRDRMNLKTAVERLAIFPKSLL